jgi:ABC-type bacteriocin/lantibiotic exporter with double-glycine peptidase domain
MDARANSLGSTVRQIGRFIAFVARNFPALYLLIGLTVFVLVLEYVATSLLIPLSSSAPGTAMRHWTGVVESLGLPATSRTWLWLFFMVMAARLLFGYLQTISTTLLGKKVHRFLSGRIFDHVVTEEPLTTIYRRSVGHYITLAGDDTFRCGTIISSLLQSVVGLSTAVVAMAVLYQFSVPLFLAVGAFLAVCAVTVGLLLRYLLRTNHRANILSRELGTTFVESLNSLRSIRALHGEEFVVATYAEQIRLYVQMLFRMDAVRAGIKAFPAVLLLVVAAFLLRPGSPIGMSEAAVFAGTIIVIRIFASLGQFVASGSTLLTDIRAVRDIEALTRNATEVEHAPLPLSAPRAPIDSVTLTDIAFGYGAQPHLFSNVHCTFRKGRSFALIGPSGSGKSTLADILLGLLKPSTGSVRINDGAIPIGAFDGQIMLVEQQPKIFSTTLRENLLFGAQSDDEKLWKLLDLVDLAGAVRALPDGLDTTLSYLGENFSGGQRQRIGIARALVRSPSVLILDEATSALDPATRSRVVANVRNHMKNGIIVFITHDEAIARLADEVIAIGDQRVSRAESRLEEMHT